VRKLTAFRLVDTQVTNITGKRGGFILSAKEAAQAKPSPVGEGGIKLRSNFAG
jgi:hypothetical protein